MLVEFYNLMSILVRKIIDHTDENFFEGYRAISREEHERLNLTIRQRFPELFESGSAGQYREVISTDAYSDEFFSRAETFIEQNVTACDFGLLIRFLEKIVLCLSKLVQTETELQDGYRSIKMLNTNGVETRIRLLPRVGCPWERSCKTSQHLEEE